MMTFRQDSQLHNIVRQIPGRSFSKTHSGWYLVDEPGAIERIQNAFDGVAELEFDSMTEQPRTRDLVAKIDASLSIPRGKKQESIRAKLKGYHEQALRMMEQKLKLKGYSDSTTRTYLQQFGEFLYFYNETHPTDISDLDITNYLLYLVEKRKLSKSTQNQAINSIKFFFEKVLKQERKVYYIERPLKEHRLPEILSQEEVMRIFEATANLKHRVMLMLIYASGLRRSELLNLRLGDVDIDRCVVFVKGGKGRKDRQTIMARSLGPLIGAYLKEFDPKFWFFEGRGGERYSATSLQTVLKESVKKAGVRKSVRLHMLRHSFATHLLESGTSTRYIQELLGHESPVTTEIYAQVTRFGMDQVKSPLDHIVQNKQLRGDDSDK
ncbi:MAG: tyrosine-type recombinase/integrase [Cyclobacteriaceae bacterium]